MIKKILLWYNEKFKKKPFVVLLITICIIFSGIGSFYGGINAVVDSTKYIHSKFFKYDEKYSILEKVNTDLSIDYLNTLLGPAAITRPLYEEKSYYESLYIWDECFIYVIFDSEKCIKLYTITIRKVSVK